MNKKIYAFLIVFLFGCTNVYAAPNIKIEDTYDPDTDVNQCPTSIIVQDNLKGEKDIDFSDLDCIYYKMDNKGNFLLDENGEKILREEGDAIDFSCLQSFLDKYTNEEFKEAANGNKAEGFPTNDYCPVYCVEENEFVFPGYAPVVNSGGHFTWTVENWKDRNILDGLTVRLHGTKVCRSHVDLEQWIDDYKKIMKDIESMISITNPISNGNGSCTPSASSGTDDLTECAYNNKPISSTTHVITANDYNTFSTYRELNSLAGDTSSSSILKGLGVIVPSTNPSLNQATNIADANSNRYYITSSYETKENDDTARVVHQGKIDGYISLSSVTSDSKTYVQSGPDVANNYFNHLQGSGVTGIMTIKVDVWERHCCYWEKSGAAFWSLSKLSDTMPVSRAGMKKNTYGYKTENEEDFCGSEHALYPPGYENNGKKCCVPFVEQIVVNGESCQYKYQCSDGSGLGRDQCILYGGTWEQKAYNCEPLTSINYFCPKNPTKYYKEQKYVVKCPWGSTGKDKAIATGGSEVECTKSSTPACLSGYAYSPKTGKCYRANIDDIYVNLSALANLRSALMQCKDQLIDYDYYLDTEMEIEYNKTNNSRNNFYLPHEDTITNTNLEKVSDNTPELDGENMLGKYSSEVVHPSEQSQASGSIDFFGQTYTFNNNGIPIPVCTLSGFEKICSAVNSSEWADYWYDWYGRTYIALYEYRLDGDFYRWVKMPEGESLSTMPTGDYLNYNRFIDIGYANYPVHFSTKANKYEGLNIRIKNIGANNYLYNTYSTQIDNYHDSFVEKEFGKSASQSELLHDCYYKVTEGEPYCPTKGCADDEYDLGSVRLIYRPISLENPFPDIDASGRDTGSNWCVLNEDKEKDCSNTNANVEKYILNNRNTSGSDIYFSTKEPMYQIELTPALINIIRDYNKQTDYDDYYLYCSGLKGKEGSECKSKFVRGAGVDIDNMPGDLGDLANTISSAISGCGTEEWDACDKLDNYER